MSWVSSLCSTGDVELISMGSGLAFRNTSRCDQAFGGMGTDAFLGEQCIFGMSWASLWLEVSL